MSEVVSKFFFFLWRVTLSGNAKLTLIVDGTLSVYGGAAGDGADSTGVNPPGGTGGFAGIFVPNGTTLTVRGGGTLSAYGGHAGDGGNGVAANNIGAAGGGGAGAGIGGNGGPGGAGGDGTSSSTDNGAPGGAGTSAGEVYLYETVRVTAYGGAGGSGGWEYKSSSSSPGGGGGYPAAGIGGGGAGAGGASHGSGGGGFSGGRGDFDNIGTKVVDGVGAPTAEHGPGGGYFSSYDGTYSAGGILQVETQPSLGGGAMKYKSSSFGGDRAGNGGAAGSGGTVKKASTATLTVSNGSYKTSSKEWGVTPTPIYAQSGYSLTKLREANVRVVNARSKSALESELGSKGKTLVATGLSGVGSGAGFTETSHWVSVASFLLLKSNIDAGSSQ